LSNGKWFVKTFLRTLSTNGIRAAADGIEGSPCDQASVRLYDLSWTISIRHKTLNRRW